MEPQKKSAGAFIGIIIIIIIIIMGGYYFYKKQNVKNEAGTLKVEVNDQQDTKAIESDLDSIKGDIDNLDIPNL